MVQLISTECNKQKKPSSASAMKIYKVVSKIADEFHILEELKVLNVKDFGKGYGKKAFLKFLEGKKTVALMPSFAMIGDDAYSGREKMSMENLFTAGKELLNKFYIPILKKNGYKYQIIDEVLIIG